MACTLLGPLGVAGARHYTELACWQLADQLRRIAFSFTERPAFNREFKRKAQIEDAIDSVCRNIAEGFGCRSHSEFVRFLEFSRRSLNEFSDALHSARLKRYVSDEEAARTLVLVTRTHKALSKLIDYLRRT